jgi:hypothetical protein
MPPSLEQLKMFMDHFERQFNTEQEYCNDSFSDYARISIEDQKALDKWTELRALKEQAHTSYRMRFERVHEAQKNYLSFKRKYENALKKETKYVK